MWTKFTLYDLRVICHYLGTLILFSSLLFVVPFLLALLCSEWEPASRYLFAAGLTLVIGSAMRFARIEPGRLSQQQAMAVTGLSWIILAFIASIPLYSSGHFATYTDALFDGVSGLTTTGASVMVDIDHVSNADNMFRFMMHLFGGLGLIVVALSFGLFGRGGGAGLYFSEGRSEHVVPNVVQTSQLIARISATFISLSTVLVMVCLLLAGLSADRAFLHALWISISGFLTGGFAPMGESIMYYHSFPLELILMLVMLLGSVNFALHSEIWKGRVASFFRDIETKTMLIWLTAVIIIITCALCATQFNGLLAILRRGLFMVIAVFSTTGFSTLSSNTLSLLAQSGAFLVLALVMAVGGSSGGTSGGMKLFRVGIVFKSLVATLKESVSPRTARVVVTYQHMGRRQVTNELVRSTTTVFVLYIITYVIGALVGVAFGYDAQMAIFDSVAMASNGGLTSGIVAPNMPIPLQMVYIFEMWAGRLEFITLLALIVKLFTSVLPDRALWGGR